VNIFDKDIFPGRLLKSSLLLLLRSTAVQPSVPLQLPDRELDAFPRLFLGVVAVPPSISLPTPQSRTLFPRTNYSDLQKQQQPT
jgi:hypothetical protein